MKILVINQNSANAGDDAAGVALAIQLREKFPDSEIHFVYSWNNNISKIPFNDNYTYHHDITIKKTDIFKVIRYLVSKVIPFLKLKKSFVKDYIDLVTKSDVIIVSPCGANIGIYRHWYSLFRVLVAVLEGHTPIFHLNTVGKSGNVIFDIISKYVLKRSDVFVREVKCYKELKKWGIYSQLGVDTVFSLPRGHKENSEDSYVIFIPTDILHYFPNFRNKDINTQVKTIIIRQLIEFCKNNNYSIKILPHLTDFKQIIEENTLNSIKSAIIDEGMDEESVSIVSDMNSFYDYERYIANSRMTVSMRYHGVIFAIRNFVPFVSLAYENKMREACMYSEMLDYYVDLENIKDYNFGDILNLAATNETLIRKKLNEKEAMLNVLARQPILKIYLEKLSESSCNIH